MPRISRESLPTSVVALLACWATLSSLAGGASAAPTPPGQDGAACAEREIRVAAGCASRAAARKRIAALVRRAMQELGVKATILRIDTGARPLTSTGFGRSMAGVPATRDMHFRIG